MKKLLLLLISVCLFMFPFYVYAKMCNPSDIIITSIELKNTTGNAEEVEANIDNNKINMNVKLKEVGDSAEYEVKVKNNSDEEYYFNNTTMTKSNEYIDYSITYEDNNTIQPQSNKQVNVKVKYKKEVPDELLEDNKFIENNIITFDIANEKISNPKTLNPIVYIMVAIMGLIILPFFMNFRKRLYILIIMGLIMIPLSVYAICNVNLEYEATVVIDKNKSICKRATSLHTTTCENSNMGCKYSIGTGNTITYGNLGTTGTLASGDAFDCDVNKDGTYDEATERFYYITSDGENSTLIYYTNVDDTTQVGNGTTGQASGNVAYHNQNYNYLGPVTAYVKLPTTSDWSNPLIIPPEENRQIKNEAGTTTNSYNGNNYPIQPFTYTNRAARLLTYQELKAACGNNLTSSGNLDNCNFLFENVERFERNGYNGALGHWLETPRSDGGNSSMFYINAGGRYVDRDGAENTHSGVRPVITVKTSNIEY